jgi:outer membrane protein assembly factor BamA
VDELFTEITAPGLTGRPRYRTMGIGAAWDRRDAPVVPTRGVYAGATLWRFSALNDQAPSFTRFTADVRAFYPIWTDRHVIAINVLGSADRTPGPAPIPFYLQSWLGGSHSLRGFSSYRLRGESVVHSAIEYRWRAHRYVEIAPFFDMGAVSATGSSLSDGPLHTALGAGLRFRDDKRTLFRIDWGHSDEGHRLSFSMSPAF